MKYIINLLGQSLLILFLANLCIAFVPRNIRNAFRITFKIVGKVLKTSIKIVGKVLKVSIKETKKIVKEAYGFYTTKKEVKSEQPSNVINLKDKAK